MGNSVVPDDQRKEAAGLSRRTLVRTAAWAVPAIAVAAPAPAMAASNDVPPNGLDGWVLFSVGSGGGGTSVVDVTGIGSGLGLWVTETTALQTISQISVVFLINRAGLTWSAASGNAGTWSAPAADGSESINPGSGVQTFHRYRMNYVGPPSLPFLASNGQTNINNALHFVTPDNVPNNTTIYIYARRYVTITQPSNVTPGTPTLVWFQRGPISFY